MKDTLDEVYREGTETVERSSRLTPSKADAITPEEIQNLNAQEWEIDAILQQAYYFKLF